MCFLWSVHHWLQEKTVEDQIESHLDSLKTQIVKEAQAVQDQNQWVSRVAEIVRHYTQKIHAVEQDTVHRKDVIRKLFAKKKKYEALLNKARLDKSVLHRVMAAHRAGQNKDEEQDIDEWDKKEPHYSKQTVFRDPSDS